MQDKLNYEELEAIIVQLVKANAILRTQLEQLLPTGIITIAPEAQK